MVLYRRQTNRSIYHELQAVIAGQRYQIEAYLREGFSYREIGKRLKVSHSTISREIRRNRIRENHYLPEVAQAKTLKRRVQPQSGVYLS
ncbi:helix-turn-helix domain-containing protein [Pseudoalteromonas gelatinilytica]